MKLLVLVCLAAAVSASPIHELISQACTDAEIGNAEAQQKATSLLLAAGWDTAGSFEMALPYIQWGTDLPGFPVGVKVALKRHFHHKKKEGNAEKKQEKQVQYEGSDPVSEVLEGLSLGHLVPTFREHGITSKAALSLLDHGAMLHYMGVTDLQARLKVLDYIQGADHHETAGGEPATAAATGSNDDSHEMTREEMTSLFTELVLSHKLGEHGGAAEGDPRRDSRRHMADLVAAVVHEEFDDIVSKVDKAIDDKLYGNGVVPHGDTRRLNAGGAGASSNSAGVAGAGLWIEDESAKIMFGADADSSMWRSADGDLRTGGNLTVDGSLSAGRGKTHPRAALDVGGDVAVSSVVSVGTLDATKALEVDGTGWVEGDVTLGSDLTLGGGITVTGSVDGVDVGSLNTSHTHLAWNLTKLEKSVVLNDGGRQTLDVVTADKMTLSGTFKLGMVEPTTPETLECSEAETGTMRWMPKDAEGEKSLNEVQVCTGALWEAVGGGSSQSGKNDPKKPKMRWATWSSYNQPCCWYDDNSPQLFGGDHPSHWGDSNGRANRITDTERLYQFFNKHIECGWSCNINANSWYRYSSTNSKHTGVWMRIYNETPNGIQVNFRVRWTAYSGWGEQKSWGVWCNSDRLEKRLGGHNRHTDNNWGDQHNHKTLSYTHPGKQYCSVIIIAASNNESGGLRTNTLLFRDNSLKLRDGLIYLNDFDDLGFGYHSSSPYGR